MVIRSSFLGRVRSGVSICKPSPADAASTAVTIRMDYWYAAMLPSRSPGAHRDADLEPFEVVSPYRCNRPPQSRQRVQREPVAILARSAKRALIIDKQRNMLRTPMSAAAGEGENSSRARNTLGSADAVGDIRVGRGNAMRVCAGRWISNGPCRAARWRKSPGWVAH